MLTKDFPRTVLINGKTFIFEESYFIVGTSIVNDQRGLYRRLVKQLTFTVWKWSFYIPIYEEKSLTHEQALAAEQKRFTF